MTAGLGIQRWWGGCRDPVDYPALINPTVNFLNIGANTALCKCMDEDRKSGPFRRLKTDLILFLSLLFLAFEALGCHRFI